MISRFLKVPLVQRGKSEIFISDRGIEKIIFMNSSTILVWYSLMINLEVNYFYYSPKSVGGYGKWIFYMK